MATQISDPKTPETKPHGTTADQVKEMESEGQAQTQGQPVESPSADQMQGAPGPVATPGPDEAINDRAGQAKDASVEVPGDTGSADIVGRTGEQMPQQSHDGLEADSRDSASHRSSLNH